MTIQPDTSNGRTMVSGADAEAARKAAWDDLEAKDRGDGGSPAGADQGKPADGSAADTTDGAALKADLTGDQNKKPDAQPADDPWKDAPPALKASFEATRAELAEATAARKRSEGTVSGLTRRINALERDLSAKKPDPDDKSAAAPKGGKGSETVERFRQDFKEVADPVDEVVATAVGPLAEQVGKLTAEAEERRLDLESQVVRTQHKDYDAVVESPAFTKFYEEAGPLTRAAIERNAKVIVNGAEVSDIVEFFKAKTGFGKQPTPDPNPQPKPTDNTRDLQLEGAGGPRSKAVRLAPGGSPTDRKAIWEEMEREDARKAAAKQ